MSVLLADPLEIFRYPIYLFPASFLVLSLRREMSRSWKRSMPRPPSCRRPCGLRCGRPHLIEHIRPQARTKVTAMQRLNCGFAFSPLSTAISGTQLLDGFRLPQVVLSQRLDPHHQLLHQRRALRVGHVG
jgi:hypothetical protein